MHDDLDPFHDDDGGDDDDADADNDADGGGGGGDDSDDETRGGGGGGGGGGGEEDGDSSADDDAGGGGGGAAAAQSTMPSARRNTSPKCLSVSLFEDVQFSLRPIVYKAADSSSGGSGADAAASDPVVGSGLLRMVPDVWESPGSRSGAGVPPGGAMSPFDFPRDDRLDRMHATHVVTLPGAARPTMLIEIEAAVPAKVRAAATAAALRSVAPTDLVGQSFRLGAGSASAPSRRSRSLFNSPFGYAGSAMDTFEQVVAYVGTDRHGSVGKWIVTPVASEESVDADSRSSRTDPHQHQQRRPRDCDELGDPMFIDLVAARDTSARPSPRLV